MKPQKITEEFTVSGQIEIDDVAAIKAAGFQSVICNRPDNEEMGQPPHEPILAAAQNEGLIVRYIPVVSGMVTHENVADMAAALEELPKPVFAYCRSGARCTQLFQFAGSVKKEP